MTEESEQARQQIEAWIEHFGFSWPVGYGALSTLLALELSDYPTTFVVNRNGTIAWHSHLPGTLDRAIRNAL